MSQPIQDGETVSQYLARTSVEDRPPLSQEEYKFYDPDQYFDKLFVVKTCAHFGIQLDDPTDINEAAAALNRERVPKMLLDYKKLWWEQWHRYGEDLLRKACEHYNVKISQDDPIEDLTMKLSLERVPRVKKSELLDILGIEPEEKKQPKKTKVEQKVQPVDVKSDPEQLPFKVVKDNEGTFHLELPPTLRGKAQKVHGLLSANEVVRQFTSMGHMKNSLPLKSAFLQLNNMRMLRDGLRNYNEFARRANQDNKIDEEEFILELISHRRFFQTLVNLGARKPDLDSDEDTTIDNLDELIDLIEFHYADEIRKANDLIGMGKITNNTLFQLFKPNMLVEAHGGMTNSPCGYRVTHGYYVIQQTMFSTQCSFHLGLECIASVGEKFITLEFENVMSSADSDKPKRIDELTFRPMSEETFEFLQRRGQRFSEMGRGNSFVEYDERSFFPLRSRRANSKSVNRGTSAVGGGGRMMIDVRKAEELGYLARCGLGDADITLRLAFSKYDRNRRDGASSPTSRADASNALLSDDQMILDFVPSALYAITWPTLVGFSFTTKCWGQVMVNSCKEVDFVENAYEQLVLPLHVKELIQALVMRHDEASFSSIIKGKGEGAVFLLHGPSGCGKTLTAEAISEMLHRPLYSVSMGELGVTPQDLEQNLQEILDICASWNALILLDEADVFVEKRERGEILRNSMVGVILRLTEYYRGVLFFTTNRVANFDPAFQSRVTVALRYEALDPSGREQVWRNVLSTANIALEQMDLPALALYELNGRQIKNVIQLAVALAKHRDLEVTQEDLEGTVNLTLGFNMQSEKEW